MVTRFKCPLINTEDFRMKNTISNAGGLSSYINSEENVWEIIDKLSGTQKLPRLMFACGEEDSLVYENYLQFKEHCKEINLPAKWFSLPNYGHEWDFWDISIREAIAFSILKPFKSIKYDLL